MRSLIFILINFISIAFIGNVGICNKTISNNPDQLLLAKILVEEKRNKADIELHLNAEKLLISLKEKRASYKSDKSYLRYIFHTISKNYLKTYQDYSTLNETLSNGSFNCVSGSLLFGYVLQKLKISYSIYETNFHVFIVAHLENKDILIETTDPDYGFITNHKIIKNKIESYIHKNETSTLNLYNKIDIIQLASHQYYNLAANHFNNKNYKKAVEKINKSIALYKNPRSEALLSLSIEQLKKQIRNSKYQEAIPLNQGIIASLE